MGISRRVAPLGTVPVGTIEASADLVPWGTNVKGEKGETGSSQLGRTTAILSHPVPRVTADYSAEPGEHLGQPTGGQRAPVVTSAFSSLGLALGALTTSALVEYAPAPTHLIWWAPLALFAASIVAVLASSERVTRSGSWERMPRR
jgi:hypothetical protein